MICQITDSADDHFCQDLWHFLGVCLYTGHNGKEHADFKLIQKRVLCPAELSRARCHPVYTSLITPKPRLFSTQIVLHILQTSSMFRSYLQRGVKYVWNWFQVDWRQTSKQASTCRGFVEVVYSGLATFCGTGFGTCGWGKDTQAIMLNSKK